MACRGPWRGAETCPYGDRTESPANSGECSLDSLLFTRPVLGKSLKAPKCKHPSMMNAAVRPRPEGSQEELRAHRNESRPPSGSFHSPHNNIAVASPRVSGRSLTVNQAAMFQPPSLKSFFKGRGCLWALEGWSVRLHPGTPGPAF